MASSRSGCVIVGTQFAFCMSQRSAWRGMASARRQAPRCAHCACLRVSRAKHVCAGAWHALRLPLSSPRINKHGMCWHRQQYIKRQLAWHGMAWRNGGIESRYHGENGVSNRQRRGSSSYQQWRIMTRAPGGMLRMCAVGARTPLYFFLAHGIARQLAAPQQRGMAHAARAYICNTSARAASAALIVKYCNAPARVTSSRLRASRSTYICCALFCITMRAARSPRAAWLARMARQSAARGSRKHQRSVVTSGNARGVNHRLAA